MLAYVWSVGHAAMRESDAVDNRALSRIPEIAKGSGQWLEPALFALTFAMTRSTEDTQL